MNLLKTIAVAVSITLSSVALAGTDTQKIGASLHKKEALEIEDIPVEAVRSVKALAPDMAFREAEKEYKHGNIYIDIEGELPDGREIEFDLLKVGEKWQVVEIQRDLTMAQLPQNVTKALSSNSPEFNPLRIIESIQHGTEIIVYEFYGKDSNGEEIREEVKLENGEATVLKKAWQH